MGVSIPLRGMPRTPSARAAPLHWHLLLPSPPCTSLATAVIVPHAVLATSDHPVNRIGIATMRRKKTPPRWAYHDWTRRAPIPCDRRVRPSHVTESPSHRLFAAIRVYIRLDTVSPIAIKSAFLFHSLLEAAVITGAGVSGVRFQNCTVLPAAGSQQHKHTSGWLGGGVRVSPMAKPRRLTGLWSCPPMTSSVTVPPHHGHPSPWFRSLHSAIAEIDLLRRGSNSSWWA